MKTTQIDNRWISLTEVDQIINENYQLVLADNALAAIQKCRTYLDEKVAKNERLIYGVNTGFGSLCNTAISNEDLELLQTNLVLSHACGTGEEVPSELVKRMIFLKVLGISHGHSGVQVETVERLIFFFNNNIF